MAYNSSHTGAQIDSAVGTVIEKESTWDGKQDKIKVAGVLKGDGKGAVSAAPYEKWTFTLKDGSTVTKTIVLG